MFDVVVIGGGHAGVEAASAAARKGARTALVTMDPATIGAMSCNPAIGGVGKGHLVREVDACDGIIARAADAGAIHYRMLNRSKGKAVHGPRVQADRARFRSAVQMMIAATPKLDVVTGIVNAIRLEAGRVAGIVLDDDSILRARSVVIASGTFLNARMFCGDVVTEGGRVRERAAIRLGLQLRDLGLPIGRMKTGTPPRLDGRTIDWSRVGLQASDADGWTMSPLGTRRLPQLFCGVTRTNSATHDVVRGALDRSPLFSGAIAASGPRYCPSIEDKIIRFGDRDGHQIFLEPEGLDTALVYPNGISTSLPAADQRDFVRTIAGLEYAAIIQAGYAVEYDHVDPRALDHSLAARAVPGLFFAGQVNGTTGYEEAAAQGLVAGANAAAQALDHPPLHLARASSYIGVMVDDLVLRGVTEPYRMLTARADHRLHLRADNAETRLTAIACEHGLVGASRRTHFARRDASRLGAATRIQAGGDGSIARRILRDAMSIDDVRTCDDALHGVATDVLEELYEDARYAPYIARQNAEIAARKVSSAAPLPRDMAFDRIPGLSAEMVQRLTAAQPASLGDAERIPGITPAALSALLVHSRAGRTA